MNLSQRLTVLAAMVTPCEKAADVGCDHGFVPIWLVESGKVRSAIAADVRSGPLGRAKEHIAEHGLEDRIETRLSDGLEKISPGEADSLIMSGIGGLLMIRILSSNEETAKSFKELILSPQSDLRQVRKYLTENGFTITYERVLREEGKYYFIFRTVPENDSRSWSEEDLCYGRDTCREDLEIFRDYLLNEKNKREKLYEEMNKLSSDEERISARKKELSDELRLIALKLQDLEVTYEMQ